MQENEIDSFDELAARADAAVIQFNGLGDSIKAAEQRMQEITALKKHIINYSRTREVYVAYRKAGYSKKFLEGHREAITLHKAAKEAFEQLSLKKLPRVKELNAESGTETGGVPGVPKGKDGDAGVPCGAESGGCPSGKGEGTGGYGGAAQGGTAHRSAQMILAGLVYRNVGQPRFFLFPGNTEAVVSGSTRGASPACPCKAGTTAFGNRTRSQPRLRGCSRGLGYGPNEQKWTSSGHAGSPF